MSEQNLKPPLFFFLVRLLVGHNSLMKASSSGLAVVATVEFL